MPYRKYNGKLLTSTALIALICSILISHAAGIDSEELEELLKSQSILEGIDPGILEDITLDENVSAEDRLTTSIATDKDIYDPGEILTLYMNASNFGSKTIFVKEIHVRMISETWFGLTFLQEVRGWTVPIPPIASGRSYAKTKLPLFTPPGTYRIEAWIVYGDLKNETHIVTELDMKTEVSSVKFEVQLGIIFIISIVLLIWLFLRLYFLPKLTQKPGREHIPVGEAVEKGMDKLTIVALIIALILSLSITLIWVGNSKQEKEQFSVLYLKQDSYSNYVTRDYVSFAYGIHSLEGERTKYSLDIFLGDEFISNREFELGGSTSRIENLEVLKIPENMKFPVKVKLVLNVKDRSYETHFWLIDRL